MKQIVVYTILLVNVFLVSCSSLAANAQSQEEPVFSIRVKNSDDQVSAQYKDNTTIVEIRSPSGIGSTAFTLESGQMPEEIVARLHLKGLEELKLISDQAIVVASIPGSGGLQTQSQRKVTGNTEQALRSSDALWLEIEIVSDSKEIPLEAGYFEIVFPKEFIERSRGLFEIQWIDFFR
jgi:hypothetical protein